MITIYSHLSVAMERIVTSICYTLLVGFYRDLMMIYPVDSAAHPIRESLPCSILSGETNSWNHISRIKSCLFNILKIVVRLRFSSNSPTGLVENRLCTKLCKIKRIVRHIISLLLSHNLNVQFPFWKVAISNCLKQVALITLTIVSNNSAASASVRFSMPVVLQSEISPNAPILSALIKLNV